jgi:hypothetical protein
MYRFDFYLFSTHILRYLNIIEGESANITYLDQGIERTIKVSSEPVLNWMFWSMKPTERKLPTTHSLRKSNFNVYGKEGSALMVEINLIENINDKRTISQLSNEIDSSLSYGKYTHLIIDLRNNTGGNNQLYSPIIESIVSNPAINSKDHFFILTSRTTFSAGINFLDDLMYKTHATLIGEPTGAGPNHYGDAEFQILPNSGIFYFLSTRKWEGHDPLDTTNTILPNIMVNYSFKDYEKGKDPWMEKVDLLIRNDHFN